MFKLIKELMNLRKSIEEKTKELNRLEKDINNRENIINNIKQNAQNEANIKSEEIINQGRQKLANIEEEISKKVKYMHIALLLSAYYTYTLTFYSTGFHLGFISKHFSLKKCLILLHIS